MKNNFPFCYFLFLMKMPLTFNRFVLNIYSSPGIKDKGNNTDPHLGWAIEDLHMGSTLYPFSYCF